MTLPVRTRSSRAPVPSWAAVNPKLGLPHMIVTLPGRLDWRDGRDVILPDRRHPDPETLDRRMPPNPPPVTLKARRS